MTTGPSSGGPGDPGGQGPGNEWVQCLHSFTHQSFTGTYCVPGTALGGGDSEVNRIPSVWKQLASVHLKNGAEALYRGRDLTVQTGAGFGTREAQHSFTR